jgi:glycosyltransferase involved in cell wall biosynthesis
MTTSLKATTSESAPMVGPALRVSRPDVEVVIPVHNERLALEGSVRMLHAFLSRTFPFLWQITIVDNASVDGTLQIARRLMYELPGVGVMHVRERGRGRALRTAWLASAASVLVYMDVDLSTDLSALLPLVAPVLSGHSELAIGTRLRRGARVVRSPKRSVISRGYNALLRVALRARFSDAQCGFKAIRADIAHELLPLVADQEWFFDTELLVLAQRCRLRIHEVPVDWVEDADSRVEIVPTALADLRGVGRLLLHRSGLDRPAADRPTLPSPRRPMLAP